jgi:hypothetical protein
LYSWHAARPIKVIISTDPSRCTGPNEVPKTELPDGWRIGVMSSRRMKSTDGLEFGASISFYYRD